MLYILTKLRKNISKGFRVIERHDFLTDIYIGHISVKFVYLNSAHRLIILYIVPSFVKILQRFLELLRDIISHTKIYTGA